MPDSHLWNWELTAAASVIPLHFLKLSNEIHKHTIAGHRNHVRHFALLQDVKV